MSLLVNIILYILLIGGFILFINNISSNFFVFLRKKLPLKGVISSAIHSFITGFLSGFVSILCVKYLFGFFELNYIESAVAFAAFIIFLFYIASFYLSIASGEYFRVAQETASREDSELSSHYRVFQIEKSFRVTHAWVVIGIILGFTTVLDFLSFYHIESLLLKIILVYFYIGLLSTIEFAGRKLPGAKGYLATFIIHLFFWPAIRAFIGRNQGI